MPELPEVETVARTLSPQIVGRCVTALTVLHAKSLQDGQGLLPRLAGARVERVYRRAKLLIVSVREKGGKGEELLLVFHLKMTGSFFVHPKGTAPLKHTRLIFDLDDGSRVFFDDMRTFGWCRIMLPEELPVWPFWATLGPEPLDAPPAELARHFGRAFAGRGRAIKAALLDQEVVAGVGNIYADESLFQAGIKPECPCGKVSKARLNKLAEALQEILSRSIKECGSSIRDYRDANGNAGAFQNCFFVYGRKGQECLNCGSALESCRVAGRGTVYCPRCQK